MGVFLTKQNWRGKNDCQETNCRNCFEYLLTKKNGDYCVAFSNYKAETESSSVHKAALTFLDGLPDDQFIETL